MNEKRKIVIIGGPNGAGKTTFAREYLPKEAGCPIFINGDLIAAGLSPFSPESAAIQSSRLMVKEIEKHARLGVNFSFETTLSGRRYARMIPQWQAIGYHVKLIFLSLSDVEIALERVSMRVQQGGHNVPETTIRRRFDTGWKNFNVIYKDIVDVWILYDNSKKIPVLLNEGSNL